MAVSRLLIEGVVQGVGFRPFIAHLARRHHLTGFVANTPAGVEIEVIGPEDAIASFTRSIRDEKPPLADIARLEVQSLPAAADSQSPPDFRIRESSTLGSPTVLPPPDTDVCGDCLRELTDPHDRRFRYPFIACTNCGPRYSMIEQLPFDRPLTSMRHFPLCPSCAEEYDNSADRRFHAQAMACPVCGPRLTLTDHGGAPLPGDPLATTVELLEQGGILAIKGLGGFHLAVDASNEEAVQELRRRKRRPHKPLAVMARNLAAARRLAVITPAEADCLTGRQKPIVLLRQQQNFPLAPAVAPNQSLVGIMLPYTPLQHLLLTATSSPALVMTSANRSGEPLVKDNDEAFAALAGLADFFLLHDRPIITKLDDSVLRLSGDEPLLLRRARSFAPLPLLLGADCSATLGLGGTEKNTFCLTRGHQAFLSQHVGDLDRQATRNHFHILLGQLEELLQITPSLLAHDLHPDYPTTRFAQEQRQLPAVAVQHHHAHAVSCMAEHGLDGPVIGVTLDGSGYGPDHTIWGGEVLLATLATYERLAFLTPVHLPGGETAVKQPWRLAVSHLFHAFGRDLPSLRLECLQRHRAELPVLLQMMAKDINSPLTSSCGRLFDGVAALLGLADVATFEGQAAMALEGAAGEENLSPYSFGVEEFQGPSWRLQSSPFIREMVQDLTAGLPVAVIANRFHATLAALFTEACRRIRSVYRVGQVVLSGGVFQNVLLEKMLFRQLTDHGFEVFRHRQVPANDGGLSLGQAVAGRAIFCQQRNPI